MDYSLLVGIRRPATPLTTSDAETGVYLSTAPDGSVIGDEVYLFGVIDILQRYTLGKKCVARWMSRARFSYLVCSSGWSTR